MAAKKDKNIGELTPGSKEWDAAFDRLSPADQAAIFNQTYNDPIATGFNDFEDFGNGSDAFGGQPALAGTSFNLPAGVSDMGLDPMTQQLLQGFGGGVAIPTISAAGKVTPYGIGEEAKRVNLRQDQATSLADVMQSALAGMGALDPSAFAPDVTMPTERLALTGSAKAQRYAGARDWKGFVVDRMLTQQMTDTEAVAELLDTVKNYDPNDKHYSPDEKKQIEEVIRTLPPALNQSGQVAGTGTVGQAINNITSAENLKKDPLSAYDQIGISKFAEDMFSGISEDFAKQAAGWEDPNAPGTWYTSGPTEEPSALTTKFRNLGLPTPMEQYTDPERMQALMQSYDPNYEADVAEKEAQDAAGLQEIGGLARKSDQASDLNLHIQTLLNDPRYQATPAGLRSPRPGGQPMNSVTQFMAPGAGDNAGNIARAQTNAALTNMASQPNQPGRPPISSVFTFQNNLGQTGAGTEPEAEAGATRANWMKPFWNPDKTKPRTLGTQKPKKLDQAGATKASQASTAARKAYENAYNADWNRRQNTLSPSQAANVSAIMNADYAAKQGRTPFTDAMIQRLLGQRGSGLRGI